MAQKIVIGLDGGGSHTRAIAADLSGQVLAYAETGGANPNHNKDAEEHVRQAIRRCMADSGCEASQVASIVAGIAGLDNEEDLVWANAFLELEGMQGPRRPLNDAQVAHAGALGGKPGIIAISGTGSIIFGINERGEALRNYDFHQYASSTARHLSYQAVYRFISGEYAQEDEQLLDQVLAYWRAGSVAELSRLGAAGFMSDSRERNRAFGSMAPLVTQSAAGGSPVARQVCREAARMAATAVRLVGSAFDSDSVDVVLIGSVLRSPYMAEWMEQLLMEPNRQGKQYVLREPLLSPVAGAVLLAYGALGVRTGEDVRSRLRLHPAAGFVNPD